MPKIWCRKPFCARGGDIETYEGRASFRAWLYKIATNASLDALERLPRRTLPIEEEDRRRQLRTGRGVSRPGWNLFRMRGCAPTSASPEARYDAYESISLAFLVALQILPPRQRTVLIFADVLDWPMSEIADVLGISLSAATSLLHRARVTHETAQRSRASWTAAAWVSPMTRPASCSTAMPAPGNRRTWMALLPCWPMMPLFPMPPMPVAYSGETGHGCLLYRARF